MTPWNSDDTPNFTRQEMACRCGQCGSRQDMDGAFMAKLQAMRTMLGPLTINCGFRCPLHPDERAKERPGSHAQGMAADIAVTHGTSRFDLVHAAMAVGMVGIGVGNGFIHVDSGHDHAPRPALWKYD